MPTLRVAVLSVILSGVGQLLLRRGAMGAPVADLTLTAGRVWRDLLLSGWIAAGLLAWAASTLLWIVVLNRSPLAHVYVLTSLNYLVVPLVSRWLFDEPLSRLQVFGMGIIAVGVLVTLVGRAHGSPV
jgi:undecaprenyl phosphate-alpha-L-ara4N flippase subunit ArnE